eukprot:NODE_42_length_34079_cov_0.552619.p12 type:complete len:183 gc:universal NODE_42_length_34079_cov_0.552619:28117-28665(+)
MTSQNNSMPISPKTTPIKQPPVGSTNPEDFATGLPPIDSNQTTPISRNAKAKARRFKQKYDTDKLNSALAQIRFQCRQILKSAHLDEGPRASKEINEVVDAGIEAMKEQLEEEFDVKKTSGFKITRIGSNTDWNYQMLFKTYFVADDLVFLEPMKNIGNTFAFRDYIKNAKKKSQSHLLQIY